MGAVDAAGLWDLDGASSMTAWLAHGSGPRTPRRFPPGQHRPPAALPAGHRRRLGQHSLSGGQGALADGAVLAPATLQRLVCDAGVHRVLRAGRSAILDYGTTTRSVPAPLWSALVLRDVHCRFPGCDRPPQWCEAHRVVPWAEGGPTCPANLVLACVRHHHRCHQPGWQAALGPGAELVVSTPDGRVLRSHPPPRPGQLPAVAA